MRDLALSKLGPEYDKRGTKLLLVTRFDKAEIRRKNDANRALYLDNMLSEV